MPNTAVGRPARAHQSSEPDAIEQVFVPATSVAVRQRAIENAHRALSDWRGDPAGGCDRFPVEVVEAAANVVAAAVWETFAIAYETDPLVIDARTPKLSVA